MNIKKGKGFTLVEVILVIGLALIIIASVFLYYSKTELENKTKESINDLAFIKGAVDQLYYSQLDYKNINETQLINAGVIPQKMLKVNRIMNPFGGVIQISGSGGSYYTRYNVFYSNIPSAACIKIASMINPSYWIIAVGTNQDMKNDPAGIDFSIDNAIKYCTTASTVTMTLQSL